MNSSTTRMFSIVFGLGALFGVLLGVGTMLSARDSENIRVMTGSVNGVNADGSKIGFIEDDGGDREGFLVSGARWRSPAIGFTTGPDPETGAPTCLVPESAGQRVRLGIVEAKSEDFSASVVVWLECLSEPTERWAALQ